MSEEQDKEGGAPPKLIVIVVVVVAIAVVVFLVVGNKSDFIPTGPGVESIDVTLKDLDGNVSKLSDYKGRVVFLNLWATWCEPCEDEMPSMQIMYEAFKNKGFVILAVSIDSAGDAPKIREFQDKYGLTFPIFHDTTRKIKEQYKTTGVPESFIIDQNGIIAEKVMGPRDWDNTYSVKMIVDLLDNGPRTPDAYSSKKSHY